MGWLRRGGCRLPRAVPCRVSCGTREKGEGRKRGGTTHSHTASARVRCARVCVSYLYKRLQTRVARDKEQRM